MTGEVHDVRAQAKLGVKLPHCGFLRVDAFKGFGVVLVHVGHEEQKLPEAPFIKQTQQTFRRQSHPVKTLQPKRGQQL